MTKFIHHSGEDLEAIKDRQRREIDDDPDTEYIVRTRAEDRSFWVRTGYMLEKYKILVWLLASALLALGFNFKTPAQSYKELSDRIDSVAKENELARTSRDTIEAKLDVLITFKCLEAKDLHDLSIARIDCSRYIHK